MKNLIKYISLFLSGGTVYYILEILWRGYSHWSMFILAGICFIICGLLNEFCCPTMLLRFQMLYGALFTTAAELVTGIIVNKILCLNVWDYSDLPLNLWGQISLQYSILWFFVSGIAIIFDDYLRYWFFGEAKPKYKL